MRSEKNDFTQGSILKKLAAFMLPILGALVLQAAYGAVDLLVVGRFGSTIGLSAVSTGSQVLNLVTFVVTQLAMGVTVLIARYLGEKKPELIGSGIGALLGNVLPFSAEGIDFAMTALFVVIMVEQWMEKQNRPSVVIGLVCGLVCRLVFGADNFILPTMICVMVILLSCKKIFDKMIPEDGKEGGEPECQ